MASVPSPHQFSVAEAVTSTNINTYYSSLQFLLNPPLFKATTTVNVSIANNAFQGVVWNNNVVDTYNGHSTTTNPSRYVAQVAGWYYVTGGVQWANNGSGIRDVIFAINGTLVGETLNGGWTGWNNAGLSVGLTGLTGPLFLNVNDYVELIVYQNTGAALNVVVGMFSVIWVHA